MGGPWDVIVAVVASVFASSGFWAFLIERQKKNSAEQRLLLGIGYYEICFFADKYLDRGWVTRQEYSDLKKYLYEPYIERGGNGTAKRLMQEIDNLPIKEE